MPFVTYTGPKDPADTATVLTVRDRGKNGERETVRLRKGVAREVPAALHKEMLAGKGRFAGHGFEDAKKDDVPDTAPAGAGDTTGGTE